MSTAQPIVPPPPLAGAPGRDHRLRYNGVRQLSSHNSYDDNGPKRNVETQLAMGIRSFEFDLHSDTNAGNWNVYHLTNLFSNGNYVQNLRQGLQKLRTFHNANPQHGVITLWLEMKDDWAPGHNPADLDALIDAQLGGLVYRPALLKQSAPGASDLQTAVRSAGWPLLDELRGKFMIVLMGDDGRAERYLYDVLGYSGAFNEGHNGYHGNRNVFCAPENSLQSKLAEPSGSNWRNAVFFNCHNNDGAADPQAIYRAGFVSRLWRIDSQAEYSFALSTNAHHLATDHITDGLFNPHLSDATGQAYRPFGV